MRMCTTNTYHERIIYISATRRTIHCVFNRRNNCSLCVLEAYKISAPVCVFLTLNSSFYPSTSCTTSVRAGCPILEETQVMWSQCYATEILRCHVCSNHCSRQCKAMPSY